MYPDSHTNDTLVLSGHFRTSFLAVNSAGDEFIAWNPLVVESEIPFMDVVVELVESLLLFPPFGMLMFTYL